MEVSESCCPSPIHLFCRRTRHIWVSSTVMPSDVSSGFHLHVLIKIPRDWSENRHECGERQLEGAAALDLSLSGHMPQSREGSRAESMLMMKVLFDIGYRKKYVSIPSMLIEVTSRMKPARLVIDLAFAIAPPNASKCLTS